MGDVSRILSLLFKFIKDSLRMLHVEGNTCDCHPPKHNKCRSSFKYSMNNCSWCNSLWKRRRNRLGFRAAPNISGPPGAGDRQLPLLELLDRCAPETANPTETPSGRPDTHNPMERDFIHLVKAYDIWELLNKASRKHVNVVPTCWHKLQEMSRLRCSCSDGKYSWYSRSAFIWLWL